MDRSTLRIISKAGILLVIIGYFMPWGSFTGYAGIFLPKQINGFKFAELAKELGVGELSFLINVMFIFTFAGLLIGILLLLKKNVPIIIDWVINIACIGGCVYFFSNPPSIIHSGFYVITIGVAVSTFFTLIASFSNEPQSNYADNSANDFTFEADPENPDTQVIITGYTGSNRTVKIPEQISGKKVSAIGKEAFRNARLDGVIIGADVSFVTGEYASFNKDFGEFYNGSGKKAGAYTYSNGQWTKQ